MKANKEQPVQSVLLHFKTKGQRLFRLGHDYQQGVKKMRVSVVVIYHDIPPNETIRFYTSVGKYAYDTKAKIEITPSNTCVYQLYLTKKPDEILEEAIVGVTAPVVVLIMIQVM